MTAAYAYLLANAGLAEATWLTAEMAALFPGQLHASVTEAADPEAMAGFRVDRKLADLASVARLVPASDREGFAPVLDRISTQIKMVAELELQRSAITGMARTRDLAPAVLDEPVQGWTGSALLAEIHPVRRLPGPISLRNHLYLLPEAEAGSWRSFWAAHPIAADIATQLCYWADGSRSLAEICRLTQLETGQRDDAGALGYFQLLSRLELVEGV